MKLNRYRALDEVRLPVDCTVALTYAQYDRRRSFVSDETGGRPWAGDRSDLLKSKERRIYRVATVAGCGFKAGEEFESDYSPSTRIQQSACELLEEVEHEQVSEEVDEDLPGVLPPLSLTDRICSVLHGMKLMPNGRPKLSDVSNAVGEGVSRSDLTKALDAYSED